MRFAVVGFLIATALGFAGIYLFRGQSMANAIYTDRFGKKWRVPSNGWITRIVNQIIEMIPRWSKSLEMIDPDFDLDGETYVYSSIMYIVFCGLIGIVFFLVIAIIVICRYICGCCGGKNPPRRGFNRSTINSIRMAMAFFSFFLEGCLIYGFFANTDLDVSMWTLVDRFTALGDSFQTDFDRLIAALPTTCGDPVYDRLSPEFKADLNFSVGYAVLQTHVMNDLLGRFEGGRMALLLIDLILATIGCSVGIAAGSVSKAWPVWLMLACNSVAAILIFFSAGTHFAGSKIIYEFCDEISYYLQDGNTDIIPMRLQYFVTCVTSPVFPYVQQYFIVNCVSRVDELVKAWKTSNTWLEVRHAQPFWFNVSAPWYAEQVAATTDEAIRENLSVLLNDAIVFADYLKIVDDSSHCTSTKAEMRAENFLFCSYMKDNMDMLTASQVAGAVLLAIVTALAIPALKQFPYAGKAGLGGVLNGNKGGGGKKGAKAKRKG
jgi:hypothetical protein